MKLVHTLLICCLVLTAGCAGPDGSTPPTAPSVDELAAARDKAEETLDLALADHSGRVTVLASTRDTSLGDPAFDSDVTPAEGTLGLLAICFGSKATEATVTVEGAEMSISVDPECSLGVGEGSVAEVSTVVLTTEAIRTSVMLAPDGTTRGSYDEGGRYIEDGGPIPVAVRVVQIG